jgi:micrococcal nuclease
VNLYFYRVKQWDVIDGDTLDLTIDLGFDTLATRRVRLMGINTPESHSRASDTERRKGNAAKEFLRATLASEHAKEVLIQTHKIRRRTGEIDERTGKYGRYMATLWVMGEDGEMIDVNRGLVAKGHANLYDGGKRPDEWEWLGEEQLG